MGDLAKKRKKVISLPEREIEGQLSEIWGNEQKKSIAQQPEKNGKVPVQTKKMPAERSKLSDWKFLQCLKNSRGAGSIPGQSLNFAKTRR
jgi:hypothetical protein